MTRQSEENLLILMSGVQTDASRILDMPQSPDSDVSGLLVDWASGDMEA
jgi:hypothetical protein